MEHQYQPEEFIFSANYEKFKEYYMSSHGDVGIPKPKSFRIVPLNEENSILGVDPAATNDTNLNPLEDNNFYLSVHVVHWASQQPHCVWPLVNLAYCLIILLGHMVLRKVFGNLRASERENVKDQFWSLVFYKVVFVFGVVNVQEVEDAVGWCFFVSIIGFLQLARQLCQDRHNYLILMNDWSHRGECRRNRILAFLSFIFISSIFLFLAVSVWYFGCTMKDGSNDLRNVYNGHYFPSKKANQENMSTGSPVSFNLGLHSALFMLCELGLLVIQAMHSLLIAMFEQFRSKWHKGKQMSEDTYSYISNDINFRFDLISLLFDLIHHVHMLVCCNLFLSMTSLIVSLQMRNRVRQIHKVLKKRQSYLWLNEHIDQYPNAIYDESCSSTIEEEKCAICWDVLKQRNAKSLPCHHIFHVLCLRQWLIVSMNCPSCRLSLVNEKEPQFCSYERTRRRVYGPRPIGLWGFLQTGQALLDLFGGWDPYDNFLEEEAPPEPSPTQRLGNYSVPNWTIQAST